MGELMCIHGQPYAYALCCNPKAHTTAHTVAMCEPAQFTMAGLRRTMMRVETSRIEFERDLEELAKDHPGFRNMTCAQLAKMVRGLESHGSIERAIADALMPEPTFPLMPRMEFGGQDHD